MGIDLRLGFAALAASLLSACAGVLPGQRAELAPMISEDVVAFNQAYADAVNAMILQNVLRGRDRLPRYYTIMSGISDAPSRESTVGGGIGGLGIGNTDGEPWAVGTISGSYKLATKPQYQITPYADDKLASALLSPINPDIFLTFSNTGWRFDFLLEVLAEDIRPVVNGKAQDACAQPSQKSLEARDDAFKCRKTLIQEIAASADKIEVRSARSVRDVCTRVGAMAPTKLDKPFFEAVERAKAVGLRYEIEPKAGADADHVLYDCEDEPGAMYLGIADKNYRVQLRSLDRTIYVLGEVARAPAQDAEPRPGNVNYVTPPGCERAKELAGGCHKVPAFQIYEKAQTHGQKDFAAHVRYNGQDYYAAPAVSITNVDARLEFASDRTSSTLTLISQILVMMQTPASVKAPTRTILEN